MGKLYRHTTDIRPRIIEKRKGKLGYMSLLCRITASDHFMAYMDGFIEALRKNNKTAITLEALEVMMIDIYNRAFSDYLEEK